jgi:hypothetical protein
MLPLSRAGKAGGHCGSGAEHSRLPRVAFTTADRKAVAVASLQWFKLLSLIHADKPNRKIGG